MRLQKTHSKEKRLVRTAQFFEPDERLVTDLHVEIETVRHIRELHGPRFLSRFIDRQLILLVARILVQRRTFAPRTFVQTVFRAMENFTHTLRFIAHLAESLRQSHHIRMLSTHPCIEFCHTHLFGSQPCQQRRACRATYCLLAVSTPENCPVSRQRVDMRRPHHRIAVTAQYRLHIIHGDEQYVFGTHLVPCCNVGSRYEQQAQQTVFPLHNRSEIQFSSTRSTTSCRNSGDSMAK